MRFGVIFKLEIKFQIKLFNNNNKLMNNRSIIKISKISKISSQLIMISAKLASFIYKMSFLISIKLIKTSIYSSRIFTNTIISLLIQPINLS